MILREKKTKQNVFSTPGHVWNRKSMAFNKKMASVAWQSFIRRICIVWCTMNMTDIHWIKCIESDRNYV